MPSTRPSPSAAELWGSPAEQEPPRRGIFLITGPNGGGKSTLARQWAARFGRVELVSAESAQAFYERELQDNDANLLGGVDTGRTVFDLVGQEGVEHPLWSAFRLGGLEERLYRRLSSGESRKVLVLAAVLKEPDVLVLDEPFDGLDREAARELELGLVRWSEELPLLWVTADPGERVERASRVLEVEGGALGWAGPVQKWRERRRVARRAHPPAPFRQDAAAPGWPETVPLVSLVNGRVAYGEQVIFSGLDWTLRRGEHTLVSGPNGSGKSTLLQLLAGDHPQAYSNELWLFGRRRGTGESVWEIKERIGLVSGQLHREYRVAGSALDVIVSGLYDSIGLYREPAPSHTRRALEWFRWLGLDFEPTRAFRELSFGEQRSLLIARAVIKEPPLLILDEPTTGLDDASRARLLALVESLCAQQKSTVLFVTHRDDERRFWLERVGERELRLGERAI